ARVPRKRRAERGELPITGADVLGEHQGVGIGVLEPDANRIGEVPEDAVVVEGELVPLGEELERRELPADAFGHAHVEVWPEKAWQIERGVVPDHPLRDSPDPGTGDL